MERNSIVHLTNLLDDIINCEKGLNPDDYLYRQNLIKSHIFFNNLRRSYPGSQTLISNYKYKLEMIFQEEF